MARDAAAAARPLSPPAPTPGSAQRAPHKCAGPTQGPGAAPSGRYSRELCASPSQAWSPGAANRSVPRMKPCDQGRTGSQVGSEAGLGLVLSLVADGLGRLGSVRGFCRALLFPRASWPDCLTRPDTPLPPRPRPLLSGSGQPPAARARDSHLLLARRTLPADAPQPDLGAKPLGPPPPSASPSPRSHGPQPFTEPRQTAESPGGRQCPAPRAPAPLHLLSSSLGLSLCSRQSVPSLAPLVPAPETTVSDAR